MLKSYVLYQERCDRAGLVDFAEILLHAHELLRDTPALLAHYRQRFGLLLVDKFQDTNSIQYGFVRLLAGDTGQAERSEEHTSELQSLMRISYAVFCLTKKTYNNT